MPDVTIHTTGEVTERLGPILYRAVLSNGKTVLAHLSKPLTEAAAEFTEGTHLLLELTPYDFDQARILGSAP